MNSVDAEKPPVRALPPSLLLMLLALAVAFVGGATVIGVAQSPGWVGIGLAALLGGLIAAWLTRGRPGTLLWAVLVPAVGLGGIGTLRLNGQTLIVPSLLVSIACMAVFATRLVTQGTRTRSKLPLLLPFGVYLLAAFFSVLPSVSVLHWARGMLDTMLGYAFFIYAYLYLKDRGQVDRVLKVLVGLATLSVLYGHLQHWFFDSFGNIFPLLYSPENIASMEASYRTGRMVSNWIYPSDFGSILNLVSPIMLYFYLVTTKNRLRWLVLFLASGSGIFLTATRGPIVAFCVSSMLLLILMRRAWSHLLMAGVALTTALILSPIFSTSLGRFDFSDPRNMVSVEGRQDATREAVSFFLENPVLGIGLRNFADRGTLFPNMATHNVYAEQLAETGALGLLAFLYLLYRASRLDFGRENARLPADLCGLRYALFCSSLAILVECLAQNSFFVWQIWCLFWLIRGISAAIAARPEAFRRENAAAVA